MVATPSQLSDFPFTRSLVAKLPTWVNQLASVLPRPVQVPAEPHGFRWVYPVENADVVQVGEAVRYPERPAAHSGEGKSVFRTLQGCPRVPDQSIRLVRPRCL